MLIKPIRWVLEMAGVADLLNIHMPAIGNYLDTGWGTLTSVAVGALIIGSSIFFHERRVGNNGIMYQAHQAIVLGIRRTKDATLKAWRVADNSL